MSVWNVRNEIMKPQSGFQICQYYSTAHGKKLQTDVNIVWKKMNHFENICMRDNKNVAVTKRLTERMEKMWIEKVLVVTSQEAYIS